jgi:hypothetical protein
MKTAGFPTDPLANRSYAGPALQRPPLAVLGGSSHEGMYQMQHEIQNDSASNEMP